MMVAVFPHIVEVLGESVGFPERRRNSYIVFTPGAYALLMSEFIHAERGHNTPSGNLRRVSMKQMQKMVQRCLGKWVCTDSCQHWRKED